MFDTRHPAPRPADAVPADAVPADAVPADAVPADAVPAPAGTLPDAEPAAVLAASLDPEADPGVFRVLSDDELEEELCSHAAHVTVAECRMVLLVAELDRREIWAGEGLRSCAHWLNWRCGVSIAAAREQVRVGRALAELPVLRAAFSAGELSYSKVRAVTRVANRRLEGSLVELARYATASQLEQIVREYRRADPDEGPASLARHDRRYFRAYTDEDGTVVIRARLSPEDGAVVLAAVEGARRALAEDRDARDGGDGGARDGERREDVSAETSGAGGGTHPGPAEDPAEEPADDADAARADALVTVCESVLSSGLDPASEAGAGVSVLVHVDEQVLEDPGAEGCAFVEEAGAISSHTARRLLCDAAVATLRYRADGSVEPEGRTRRIPATLRRAVRARDRGCRWPGCTQRRFVDVHHVRYVSQGGRTVPSNLTSLCRRHHRLVHEGRFVLQMTPPGQVRVFAPDGAEIPAVPRPAPASGPGIHAQHRRAGRSIGPETLRYCGEPFDLGLTVDALWCRSGHFPEQPFPDRSSPAGPPPGAT